MSFARKVLLPLAAVFQIAGSSLPMIFGWGETVSERSNALSTAIVPAGWAFSIWGVIFLWSLIFAGFAATRSTDKAGLAEKVAWPAIGAYTANGVWGLYTPMFGLDIWSEVIIVTGLFCAVTAALIAGRASTKTKAEIFLISMPVALLAGWLSAAAFVGGSSVFLGLGVAMTLPVLLGILAAATIFASAVYFAGPSRIYLLPVIWGLSAIITKNLDGGEMMIVYGAGAAIAILVLLGVMPRRRA